MRPVARCLVTVLAALVAAIAPSTVVTAAPVPAAATVPAADMVAAPACTAPYEQGSLEATKFNWLQRVHYRVCTGDTGYTVEAYVGFDPQPGFNASHVTGCTAHFRLQNLTDQYRQVDCTAQAKTGAYFASYHVKWSGLTYASYYLLDGWVNIQTGVHYEGYPHSVAWVRT